MPHPASGQEGRGEGGQRLHQDAGGCSPALLLAVLLISSWPLSCPSSSSCFQTLPSGPFELNLTSFSVLARFLQINSWMWDRGVGRVPAEGKASPPLYSPPERCAQGNRALLVPQPSLLLFWGFFWGQGVGFSCQQHHGGTEELCGVREDWGAHGPWAEVEGMVHGSVLAAGWLRGD